MDEANSDLINLTADIVSAHVSHNNVASADVAVLIRNVYDALSTAGAAPAPETPRQEPAVAIRASVKPDYIVCLEDGQKLQMLKRYLRTNFAMTPEEYRAKWNLPRDYPMVAPGYAEKRRNLAKQIGLGRKSAQATQTVDQHAVEKVSDGDEATRALVGAGDQGPQAKEASEIAAATPETSAEA